MTLKMAQNDLKMTQNDIFIKIKYPKRLASKSWIKEVCSEISFSAYKSLKNSKNGHENTPNYFSGITKIDGFCLTMFSLMSKAIKNDFKK